MTDYHDRVAGVALAPLLLAQGLWVTARAPRMPEAEGARSGVVGDGPDLRLLILGDSSAAGVGVATQDDALVGHLLRRLGGRYRLNWHLVARNGVTTARLLRQIRCAQLPPFDAVVVALGVNDVKNGVSSRGWRRDYGDLLDLLAGRFGARLICVSGVPPIGKFPLLPNPLRWVLGRRAARFDGLLQTLAAARDGVAHLPLDFPLGPGAMAADGFHPGAPVLAAWAEAIGAKIESHLPAG